MILFAWNWYLAPTCQLAAATHEGAESVVQDNCKLVPRAYNFSCPQSGMAKHSDAKRYAAMNDRKDSWCQNRTYKYVMEEKVVEQSEAESTTQK